MSALDIDIRDEPLLVQQVATALGLAPSSLARSAQRARLGLVLAEPPSWCVDRRIRFFTPASVLAARERLQEQRARLRAARSGALPATWPQK